MYFFFASRRRHTRYWRDWSSDVCSSDLEQPAVHHAVRGRRRDRPDGPGQRDVVQHAAVDDDVAVDALRQIGIASCRERVLISGVAVSLKKKLLPYHHIPSLYLSSHISPT